MFKKHKQSSQSQQSQTDMTPMLDIVFIMLLFFIVTTSFVKEQTVELSRPTNQCQANCGDEQPILVTINEQEEVIFDQRIIDIEAIQANIESKLASNLSASILIKIHENATNKSLISAVDQAKKAGFDKVNVAKWN